LLIASLILFLYLVAQAANSKFTTTYMYKYICTPPSTLLAQRIENNLAPWNSKYC